MHLFFSYGALLQPLFSHCGVSEISRLCGLFSFFSGPRSLQYEAECLGWSGSLLLQTEAALIGDYGREQIDYRYVLYMTPLQKTQTIPLRGQDVPSQRRCRASHAEHGSVI